MSPPDNGWSAYQNLVLSEIADLKKEQAETRSEVVLLRIDVAMLKVKSGIWGAAGAAIVTSAAGLVAAALGAF